MPATSPLSAPALLRTADLELLLPSSHAIRTGVSTGQLVRLRRGVYVAEPEWRVLDADARYLARIRAAVASLPTAPVLSHQSAAAMWGLPIIGPWPTEVHVTIERASGGRSDPGIRRHALGLVADDVTTVDGMLVTTRARTVVDLAAARGIYSAVATADAAIQDLSRGPDPLLTKNDLFEQWGRMVPFKGFDRARRVIEFAEELSGSTSESTSRTTIAMLGAPAPQLQREFLLPAGGVDADFYWHGVDGIGECDGFEKYSNPALRNGRTLEQVLIDEKLREDALRRQVSGFQRWGSAEAMSPTRLRVKLLELGLPLGRPRISGR